jgi:hypothetical protein
LNHKVNQPHFHIKESINSVSTMPKTLRTTRTTKKETGKALGNLLGMPQGETPSTHKSALGGSVDETTTDPAIDMTTIAKMTAGTIIAACHDNAVAIATTTTSTAIAKNGVSTMPETYGTTKATQKGTGKALGNLLIMLQGGMEAFRDEVTTSLSNQLMPSAQKSTSIGSMIDETTTDPAIATMTIAETPAEVNIAACNDNAIAIATTTTSNQSTPSTQKSASSGSMIDEMMADPAITTMTIAETTAGVNIAACHDDPVATAMTTMSTTFAKESSGTAIAKTSTVGSIAGTGTTIALTTMTNTATVDTSTKKPASIKKQQQKNAKRFNTWFKEGKGK